MEEFINIESQDNSNFSEIEMLHNLLADNFYQTIQVLSSIVTIQEKYYEGSHSRYVSQKSVQVAKALNVNEETLFEIEVAGLLHDIGKIGFPENILTKYQVEMKEIERKQYQLHPFLGKQILEKHKGFLTVAEIIYQHHERIDGTGFPRRLQRGEIHPGALIIAVVDAFHNSFYKKIKGTSTLQYANNAAYLEATKSRFASAMNFLHQKSDVFFDQRVVEVFLDIVDLERRNLGIRNVMRLPIHKIEPGMYFAEDYFTSFGLLIAARGEVITEDMLRVLMKFAEAEELPAKILVLK
jgi:putative nucleotidyltransferase with HDIG domain